MLRDVEADGDRGGVAVTEVKVDVAHGGVESARVGVDDFVGNRHRAFKGRTNDIGGRPPVPVPAFGTSTGEEEHVADTLLVAGRVSASRNSGRVAP